MCGIAGIILHGRHETLDLTARLVAMQRALSHRGPDDAGVTLSAGGAIGVVNCRLAIRDLSPAGHMPMGSDDGRVVVTFNGEIYNAEELRSQLEGMGHRFRSRSDTEVILRGYESWGRDIVTRLRGMFAFAVLDDSRPTPSVLLARDRLGIKPLYYCDGPDGFAFASELKALLKSGLLPGEISQTSLVAYLLLGSVPNPLTIYKGADALPPASTLEVVNGSVALRTYWQLPIAGGTMERQEATAQVREILTDSVRRHLVSDVPLGAFLSGGLDSSAVVALMRATGAGTIRTCSITFPEAEYSEAPFARAVAASVGSEHFEETVTGSDVSSELGRILWAMDQPTIDGVNTYFVSRAARRAGLTVAMSGLGGDELFGGYPNTFDRLPALLSRLRVVSLPGGARMGRFASRFVASSIRAKVADAFERPPSAASAYLACRGLFAPSEVAQLVQEDVFEEAMSQIDLLAHIQKEAAWPPPARYPTDLLGWISRVELRMYMHNQLLRDVDAMSMSHSLEVRVPFLDDRVVEAVLSMPSRLKTGPGPKPLLLDAIGDLLPEAVRSRKGKQGFTFPFDQWLRRDLAGVTESSLAPASLQATGWLRPTAVARVQQAYATGKTHWSRLWGLVVLQMWCERDPE